MGNEHDEHNNNMLGSYSELKDFYFSVWDYITFSVMILVSTGVGIYYGYFKRTRPGSVHQEIPTRGSRRATDFGSEKMNEYLLGSRKMKAFPVAMSLVASYVSGVTILGTASEIYYYGTQYCLIGVAIILMGIAVALVYLPVFETLRVGSSYEYLELRFSSVVRSMASFLFVLDEILFLPMIVYIPAIAFNQVTGINVVIIAAIISSICVLYTLIGGIKAVVHTDAWQILVMFVAVIVIVILGIVYSSGPLEIFRRANEGGRIVFFNMDFSMYPRHTFWSVIIGGFFYWTAFNAVNQTMVQRYMSLPTLKKAQLSVMLYIIGVTFFVLLCCFLGILIYDFYVHCDPRRAGLISNDDQMLPIYVMETVGHLKGIPGIFIAGVFGAALSSLSVVLNSTGLVILEDIVKGCFHMKITERAATILVKSTIGVLGFLSFILIFALEHLGGILSVATAATSIAGGTNFGMFTMGMLIPWTNTKGALAGAAGGALLSGWVAFGSQISAASGLIVPQKLPISVANCMPNVTITNIVRDESNVFPLYRLSFLWITPIGVCTTIIVGVIVSFITGANKVKTIDADLLSPVIYRFLPPECFQINNNGENETRLLGGGRIRRRMKQNGKHDGV